MLHAEAVVLGRGPASCTAFPKQLHCAPQIVPKGRGLSLSTRRHTTQVSFCTVDGLGPLAAQSSVAKKNSGMASTSHQPQIQSRSLVTWHGPVIWNPYKPTMTPFQTTFRKGAHSSDPGTESKGPYQAPIGNPLEYIKAQTTPNTA